MPEIRRATLGDAAPLAELASTTFAETYTIYNDPADMASHLAARYSEARQAQELADPAATYLVAEWEGRLVAYAYLIAGRRPGGIPLDRPVELVRFYVASAWHGRGLAQRLMSDCIAEARRRDARTLWLGVWQRNARAIAFYRKAGFLIVGTTTFRLGSQVQDDHVMALELTPNSTS